MAIIANGTKVKHKSRTGVYAIITGYFYSSNDGEVYYHVDVYSQKTNIMSYKKGNWMGSNCIPIDYKSNAQAKKLLESDY